MLVSLGYNLIAPLWVISVYVFKQTKNLCSPHILLVLWQIQGWIPRPPARHCSSLHPNSHTCANLRDSTARFLTFTYFFAAPPIWICNHKHLSKNNFLAAKELRTHSYPQKVGVKNNYFLSNSLHLLAFRIFSTSFETMSCINLCSFLYFTDLSLLFHSFKFQIIPLKF